MTSVPERWPDGRRGAVSITFDNLGEAAELELGLRSEDDPLGDHYSVTTALPIVLEELAAARLPATFFVEGLNAEVYPGALRDIADAGHEVAYHAWRHEDWGTLEPDREEEILNRGAEALRAIGLPPAGFRPPGGRLNSSTLDLLRQHGFSYCSPAETGAETDTIVLLPFEWPAVDAFHVLPNFAAHRRDLNGSEEPGGPEAVLQAFHEAIDQATAEGRHVSLVLHPAMIEFELEVVREILARVSQECESAELWAPRCAEAAEWIASR